MSAKADERQTRHKRSMDGVNEAPIWRQFDRRFLCIHQQRNLGRWGAIQAREPLVWPTRQIVCNVLEIIMEMGCWTLDLIGAIIICRQVISSWLQTHNSSIKAPRVSQMKPALHNSSWAFGLLYSPTLKTKGTGFRALLVVNWSLLKICSGEFYHGQRMQHTHKNNDCNWSLNFGHVSSDSC